MITLVLGGTRSGKSGVAERLVSEHEGPITYLATAWVDPDDRDHRARIEAHRARRPAGWSTVECPRPGDVERALTSTAGPILLDSIGTWLTAHDDLAADPSALAAILRRRSDPTVVVSEEVGLAVHPPTPIGRRYVDAMGLANQAIGAVADRVLLVVAGRSLVIAEGPLASGDTDDGDKPC